MQFTNCLAPELFFPIRAELAIGGGGSVVTNFQERGPNAYFHPIFTSLVGQKLIILLRRGAMAPFGPYAATPMYM